MAVLVVDTGSSSMRTVVFAETGEILFSAQQEYSMDLGPDGRATMQAAVFEQTLTKLLSQTGAFIKEKGISLRAVSLTSQRSSVLAVDRDGKPLYPILMWYDKRSSDACANLSERYGEEIYRISGMRLTPVASAPKMRWLRENEPAVYEKAFKLVGIHDYLLFLLTGNFVTDASLACRSALMDIRSFAWSDRLCALFGVEKEKLCHLLPPGSVAGTLKASVAESTGLTAGIPVISAGGDQQSCVLGQGLTEPGMLSVNSGSASYITALAEQPVFDPNMEVGLNAHCIPEKWVCEASNMSSGTAYRWFFQTFYGICGAASLKEMDEEIAARPAKGADGVICVPDFAGRGCPAIDPQARGVFFNVGLDADRGDFARALLEGIACDIAEAADYLKKMGVGAGAVWSTGGLTKFSVFNQITADLLGRPVTVRRQRETTALGALIGARVALGDIDSPQAFFADYSAQDQVFEPQHEGMKIYAELLQKRRQYKEKVHR